MLLKEKTDYFSLVYELLFDQNLSPFLLNSLADIYPDSIHVQEVNLHSAKDKQIWDYAKKNNLIILTKDDDFREKNILFGFPPKVILLKTGNCSTVEIENILRKNYNQVEELYSNKNSGILIIF